MATSRRPYPSVIVKTTWRTLFFLSSHYTSKFMRCIVQLKQYFQNENKRRFIDSIALRLAQIVSHTSYINKRGKLFKPDHIKEITK